jgi:plastocyanin
MKMGRLLLMGVALVAALTLAACGNGGSEPPPGGGVLNVAADGENLAFAPATLTAKAGAPASVAFTNSSSAQQHNFVLVNGGDDIAGTVDEEAIAAGAPDYVPTGSPNVIASTKIVAPGASETINFTAPAAGTYSYICTFPGHYAAGMKGTLTVEP